jgi:hypothetical protein
VVLACAGLWSQPGDARADAAPVYVGFDGEFGLPKSISAEQIEKGILIAMDEINPAGGVLGGRPMKLISKANRSMPARGIKNIQSFAKIKDMTAVVSGRFSPVVLETLDVLHRTKMINLAFDVYIAEIPTFCTKADDFLEGHAGAQKTGRELEQFLECPVVEQKHLVQVIDRAFLFQVMKY